jgi:uncharacterized protein
MLRPKRLITRRAFLASSGAVVVAATAEACLLEPNRVAVTHNSIGRSAGRRPIRVVQLSDLHLKRIGKLEERVASAVHRLAPDLIVITGDSVDHRRKTQLLRPFLELIKTGAPMLATLGNWEHWAGIDVSLLRNVYEGSGCELLVNQLARLRLQNHTVTVVGLDDYIGGVPNLSASLAFTGPTANALLLEHCPVYRDIVNRTTSSDAAVPFACMLAGHTHGGQVACFGWAPFRPNGSGKYVAGMYADGQMPLYVSRGIGTSVIPARFGAVPEVALIEWYARGD